MNTPTFLLVLSLCCYECLGMYTSVHVTAPRGGVTGEECVSSSYCEGDRTCIETENILAQVPCQSSQDCVCSPKSLQTCNSSQDCQAREACASIPQLPNPTCISAVILSFTPDATELTSDKPRPQVSDSVGLSFYPCKTGDNCKGSRLCLSADGPDGSRACQEGQVCQCYPSTPQFCSDSSACEQGEVCAHAGTAGLCIAADVVAATTSLSPVEGIPGVTLPPSPSARVSGQAKPSSSVAVSGTPKPSQSGATGASVGPSESTKPVATEAVASVSPSPSGKHGSTVQASQTPGVSGSLAPSSSPTASISVGSSATASVSVSASASPSQSESGVGASPGRCIDAEALEQFGKEELVFAEHSVARVLCDGNGSCATAGHIVVWKGGAMMMRSYCGRVGGCVEQEMAVNSPRFRRGLRVGSKTAGLEYTAFAARFETMGEEKILEMAVRLGL